MIAKILVGLLLLICTAAALLWGGYNQALTTPVVLEQSQVIEIEKGDTFTYEGLEEYDLGEITWSFTEAT